MASIYKRKEKGEKGIRWRAVVRIKGYPTVCDTFDRKQEAEDWSKDVERQIKSGQYNFNQNKHLNTFNQLVERFLSDGGLEHHRSKKDTLRHLDYWKKRIGEYGLVHITSELVGKERKELAETPTHKGTKRSPATTNRYMATLSSLLTYATKELKWIAENPCLNVMKLKENEGRDRVLSQEEIARLFIACKQSKSPYLFCIVLVGFTTGARLGEILNLEWRHVDLTNKLAYLRETKNGRPRSIALSDEVIEELKFSLRKTKSTQAISLCKQNRLWKNRYQKSLASSFKESRHRELSFS